MSAAPEADGGTRLLGEPLLGRRTSAIWSDDWPTAANGPSATRLNAATQCVATYRPDDPGWGPVEALGPNVVEDVRRVKATGGPASIVWGRSTLTPVGIEHGLADGVVLLVYPVSLGSGQRLLSDRALSRSPAVEIRAILLWFMPRR